MYPARIFAVLLTICLIICSLSLPVSATATALPYTQSSDSLTTNGLYLRLNLRNEWGNSNCTDLQPSPASDYLSVTFTISGLGKLSEPYVVSLLGAAEDLTFFGTEEDTATPGEVHITRDGTYQVKTLLPHAVAKVSCLMLETNIPLAAYTDTMVAADTGIAITVQQITTETDAPVVQSERGDPDGDGTVSVQDAVMVLTYYAKKSVGLKPETDAQFQYIQRGDIDEDGVISVQDAVLILTYYAKKSAGYAPDWDNL